MKKIFQILIAVCVGVIIAYVDSRPNWDDTGITALVVLLTCGVFAFFSPNRWWGWAIAVGLWIPVVGILYTRNFGSILALMVAFVGALSGMLIRKGFAGKPIKVS